MARFFNPRRIAFGFSLMELVLVMSIISILSAIAAPRYIGSIQNYRVKAAAKRIQVDLEYARTRAKSISMSKTVAFDVANDNYTISSESALDRSGRLRARPILCTEELEIAACALLQCMAVVVVAIQAAREKTSRCKPFDAALRPKGGSGMLSRARASARDD